MKKYPALSNYELNYKIKEIMTRYFIIREKSCKRQPIPIYIWHTINNIPVAFLIMKRDNFMSFPKKDVMSFKFEKWFKSDVTIRSRTSLCLALKNRSVKLILVSVYGGTIWINSVHFLISIIIIQSLCFTL